MIASSELQATFPGGVGESLHLPVEEVTATVEHHLLDAGRLRALGYRRADGAGRLEVVMAEMAQRLLQRGGGRKGTALGVVHQLNGDVLVRAVNAETRLAVRELLQPVAHAQLPAEEEIALRHRHQSILTSSCLPCGRCIRPCSECPCPCRAPARATRGSSPPSHRPAADRCR